MLHGTRMPPGSMWHLQCIDNRVVLTIEDNGVGFDTTRTRQGMGVSNMQERLLECGRQVSH